MLTFRFDPTRRRRHKRRNLAQTALLMGGMLGLFAVSAWLVAGADGVVWAVAGGVLVLALTPQVSPRLVLRLYGAQEIQPEALPEAYDILAVLAGRAELPARPRLYYLPSSVPTAFAVGDERQAAIAVTDGLLRRLTPRELAGVLAHEISHIRNRDLRLMNLADVMSRVTRAMSFAGLFLLIFVLPVWLARGEGVPWLLVLVLTFAPSLGSLLQLALSRAREFDADLDAAGLTGDPVGLASALEKLHSAEGGIWQRLLFPGRRSPDPSLLRTHPPTEERIRRLLDLAVPAVVEPWPDFGLTLAVPRVVARPRLRITGVWY
ncbi:MAG: zinc metalloprotease HtpX [Magnetospirillum sp. WYHS-4]